MLSLHSVQSPAVDSSRSVYLLSRATKVCPDPLLAIPGITAAAAHSQTVVDLLTRVLVSEGLLIICI